MILPYDAIVGHSKRDKPGFLREQHCMNCRSVLAMELTDKFGSTYAGEWWVVKEGVMLAGEIHLFYEKKRWYGNHIVCPVCHREGKLPIDKPYNWELIKSSKEERNGISNKNN